MDDFFKENTDENEIYFSKPDGFEPLCSLFDRLERELMTETLHGRDGTEGHA